MASTFKTFLNSDIANTRTLLHEAIPLTGTISSGTYSSDGNIKTFAHGMFESVYDYPYLVLRPTTFMISQPVILQRQRCPRQPQLKMQKRSTSTTNTRKFWLAMT